MTYKEQRSFVSTQQRNLFHMVASNAIVFYVLSPLTAHESPEDEVRGLDDLYKKLGEDYPDLSAAINDDVAGLRAHANSIRERHGDGEKIEPGPIERLAWDAYKKGILPIIDARKDQSEDGYRRAVSHSSLVLEKLKSEIKTMSNRNPSKELHSVLNDVVPAYLVAKEIATMPNAQMPSGYEGQKDRLEGLMEKHRQAELSGGLGGV